jgi:hypothetical protein
MKPPGANAGGASLSRVREGPVSRPSRLSAPNSNREPLRLETLVTQTKQSIATDSNREKEACFSPPKSAQATSQRDRVYLYSPGPHPVKGEQESNRECFRLEIVATRRKQRIPVDSNREKTACFSAAKRIQITSRADSLYLNPSGVRSPKGEQKSNRECFRLEIVATRRKQRIPVDSNREKGACFSAPN